jgi:hypothetical protein
VVSDGGRALDCLLSNEILGVPWIARRDFAPTGDHPASATGIFEGESIRADPVIPGTWS